MININVEKLQGHPKNPRTSVENVSELAESIRELGVLQNLTVVKAEDDMYTVIIGHRRLKASILAGLKEVPCVIAEMDMKTQLATMLVENMQRNDLTPLEQAQGIQQCIDFGMSDAEIAESTGFSKSTIRNRKQLLKLDLEKVKQAVNITMDDYIKLERIDNIEERNELLADAGSLDFNIKIEKAYREQENEKYLLKLCDKLTELSVTQLDDYNWNTYDTVKWMTPNDLDELEQHLNYLETELEEDVKYYYCMNHKRIVLL